jgi:hypothetical protein
MAAGVSRERLRALTAADLRFADDVAVLPA